MPPVAPVANRLKESDTFFFLPALCTRIFRHRIDDEILSPDVRLLVTSPRTWNPSFPIEKHIVLPFIFTYAPLPLMQLLIMIVQIFLDMNSAHVIPSYV